MSLLMDALKKVEEEKNKAKSQKDNKKINTTTLNEKELTLKPIKKLSNDFADNQKTPKTGLSTLDTNSLSTKNIKLKEPVPNRNKELKDYNKIHSFDKTTDKLAYKPTIVTDKTIFNTFTTQTKFLWVIPFLGIFIITILTVVIYFFSIKKNLSFSIPIATKNDKLIPIETYNPTQDKPIDDKKIFLEKILIPNKQNISPNVNTINSDVSIPIKQTTTHKPPVIKKTEPQSVKEEEINKEQNFDKGFVSKTINSEQIKILKASGAKQQNSLIKKAYNAYQINDLKLAKSLYLNALKNNDNRDARLGLAAIAIKEGVRETAYRHYAKLLEQNPNDALVLGAITTLYSNADPIENISSINLLIKNNGEIPYLYFVLGNIYAKQSNWDKAHQAFLKAYSIDNTNIHYLLNLAISLDQLGQYRVALNYYKKTMQLAKKPSYKFNHDAIKKRINTLLITLN